MADACGDGQAVVVAGAVFAKAAGDEYALAEIANTAHATVAMFFTVFRFLLGRWAVRTIM